jgi:hypothetical protein
MEQPVLMRALAIKEDFVVVVRRAFDNALHDKKTSILLKNCALFPSEAGSVTRLQL